MSNAVTRMQELIEIEFLKEKTYTEINEMFKELNTKLNTAEDKLNDLSKQLVSVSDRTIEDKATELSQKLTDDEGEQIDIQDNFRDGAKWMRAMIQLHSR